MIKYQLSPLGRQLRRFHAEEGGNATIEFVLFIPFFFAFFLSSIEMGMLMVRQTMLDRGTDITTRLIQLGQMTDVNGQQVVNRENIRFAICGFSSGMIPDCDNNLRVEMLRIDPHDWETGARQAVAGAECRDRDDPAAPALGLLQAGGPNELVVLRVCALVNPVWLNAGIGQFLQRRSGDAYALFSLASFVVEPS